MSATNRNLVYIARHAIYVIDAEGDTIAIGQRPPPVGDLTTTDSDGFGWLYRIQPRVWQLCGPWLLYLSQIARAYAGTYARPLLCTGDVFRLRTWRGFDSLVRL